MSHREKTINQLSIGLLAVPLFLGVSTCALATNGILPLGNGMTAHGLGGAGIANPSDAMAAADNPALLAETGDQIAAGLTLFAPHRAADIGNGYVDSDKNLFPIPMFGWTKTLNPKMNTGVVVTAMGGMNTTYPAALLGTDFGMDLSGLIIAPTFSYAPSQGVAYGVSALLGYEKLTTTLPTSPGASTSFDTTDSATGTGLKVGVTYQFSENTQLGAFYQSRIKMGQMDKHCTEPTGAFYGAVSQGIQCELNLAPITGVGFKLDVTDSGKLVMDLMHIAWSKVELFKRAFGWGDQNVFKFGYEYKMNAGLTLRYGVNFGKSPLNSEYIHLPGPVNDGSQDGLGGVMAPAVSERHYTFGFTKKMGQNELVGYYAFIPKVEQTDPGNYALPNGSGGTYGGGAGNRVKMYQHAIGFGFNWK